MKTKTTIVALACSAAALLTAFTTFSGNPRWPLSGGFHYVADLNTTSFPVASVWDNNAQYALSDWRDIGSTAFVPGFYRINSDYNNHANGVSSWVWLNRPADGWLAVTYVRWTGSTMTDCDIWYNSRVDYTWTNGLLDPTQSRPYWPVDFRVVARHETGHAIGLDHTDTTLCNMNAIYQHGNGVQHGAGSGMMPHADDKNGCRYLYPGSGTTTNVLATRWREPDTTANNGARWLDTTGAWAAGSFRTIQCWLANQSNTTVLGGSTGIRVGVYLSTNTTISTGDTLIGEYTFGGNWGAYASGLYTTIGGTVPSDTPAGTYYVGVIFDNTGLVAEQFEVDNAALVGTVSVTNTLRTLSVQSTNPPSGVTIGVTPLDSTGAGNGATAFTRTFWNTELVTLTAPATNPSGVPFKRWRLDGANQTLGVTTLNVSMTANHTAIADYYLRTAGSITTLGTSCPGTTGLSSHTATAPKGYPFIGDSTTVRLSNARANTACAFYLGASKTVWGAYTLPLNLAFIGISGCFLRVSVDANVSTTTNGSGIASITLPPTPNIPALIGGHIYTQFAYLDTGAPYVLPVPHSNALDLVIGGDQ